MEDTPETRQEEGHGTSYKVEQKGHRSDRSLDERPREEERTACRRVADKRPVVPVEERSLH